MSNTVSSVKTNTFPRKNRLYRKLVVPESFVIFLTIMQMSCERDEHAENKLALEFLDKFEKKFVGQNMTTSYVSIILTAPYVQSLT